MKRWFKAILPAPLMTAALFVFWLVLNRSVSPGQLLLGAFIAWFLPILARPLRPVSQRLRSPLTVIRLIGCVFVDIFRSNLEVIVGILRPGRLPRSDFVVIPLELRDAHGLAAMAVICAGVPGSVWCELAPDRSSVRIHVYEVDDPQAYIDHWKRRYERPLMEIFE